MTDRNHFFMFLAYAIGDAAIAFIPDSGLWFRIWFTILSLVASFFAGRAYHGWRFDA